MTAYTLAEAVSSGRGSERPFRCHMHNDTNASASVNVDRGVWVCYACGAAGQIDAADVVPDLEQLTRILLGSDPPRTYPDTWLDIFDAHGPSPYWSKRYGEETASHYRCGTHPVSNLPTYPIRDANGRVNGVVVRDGRGNPKYRYPYGSRTSATFFGSLAPRPVVVLVEGASDVMALHGHPQTWAVLGCYGAGVHQPQTEVLARLNPKVIVLAFDDDDAGRSAMLRSHASLDALTHTLSYRWSTIGGKDPGELPKGKAVQGLSDYLESTGYRTHAT